MKKLLILLLGLITLSSCFSVKQTTIKTETNDRKEEVVFSWPEWLHFYAEDLTDKDRLSVISLIDSVYSMIEDSTKSAVELEQPICRMSKAIEEAVCSDSIIGFGRMMRATARNFAGMFPSDMERLGEIDCVFPLMGVIPNLWLTVSNEMGDMMCNTLFADSWSSMGRYVDIVFSSNIEPEHDYAAVILVNNIDTTIDAVVVSFHDNEGNLITGSLGFIESDVSDAENGCVWLLMSTDVFMHNIVNSHTMTITYNTRHETVSMTGMPGLTFKEQLESCPRLKAIMEDTVFINEK